MQRMSQQSDGIGGGGSVYSVVGIEFGSLR